MIDIPLVRTSAVATGVKMYYFSPAWMNAFTFSISLHLLHPHIGPNILRAPCFDAQTPLFTCSGWMNGKVEQLLLLLRLNGRQATCCWTDGGLGTGLAENNNDDDNGPRYSCSPTIHSVTTAKPFFNYSQGFEAKLDCSGQFVGLRHSPGR